MANNYTEFSEAIGDITEEEKKWIEDELSEALRTGSFKA